MSFSMPKPSDTEFREAEARGIKRQDYKILRLVASHAELLKARAKHMNLKHYGVARGNGASHAEVLKAHDKHVNLHGYSIALRYASHADVLKAHAKHIDLMKYGFARKVASHAEVIDADAKHIDLSRYTKERERGTSHAKALVRLGK